MTPVQILLPVSLAEVLQRAALAAERCAAAAEGITGLADAASSARDAGALCRCAALLIARQSPFAQESTRFAISSLTHCRKACELETESLFRACAVQAAAAEAAYHELYYRPPDSPGAGESEGGANLEPEGANTQAPG